MGKLKDKIAIITGGSSGIGRAVARLFATEGATVVIAARRAEKLGRLAGKNTRAGGKCLAVATDVSKRDQVDHLVQTTLNWYSRIDILINNAGILLPPAPMVETEEAEWDQVFGINTNPKQARSHPSGRATQTRIVRQLDKVYYTVN